MSALSGAAVGAGGLLSIVKTIKLLSKKSATAVVTGSGGGNIHLVGRDAERLRQMLDSLEEGWLEHARIVNRHDRLLTGFERRIAKLEAKEP